MTYLARALLLTTVTCFAGARFVQSFAAFTDDEVDEHECRQGVCPPEAEECVEEEANQQGEGHVGAGDTAHGIGLEGCAADAFGDTQLALPEERHDDGCRQG